MSVVQAARRLIEQQSEHPVLSVYLDLDPERFATPRARISQIHSLLDQARREVDSDGALSHDDRAALREDLKRVEIYLLSEDPPFQGARALALFCSGRDDLFEVVQLSHPADGRVVVERTPYVEPLIRGAEEHRWCVALVTRRIARILTGSGDRLQEGEAFADEVRGQHDQGGWSQASYRRSIEKDVDDHLRRVADELYRRSRRGRFDRLVLGGPVAATARLEQLLREDLRGRLTSRRLDDVDVMSATEAEVRAAMASLVEADERQLERDALDRLAEGIASGGRAAGGPERTLEALNERRVEALLLEGGFDRPGGRCLHCGLLSLERHGPCPADGTELEEIEHLREATVEAALAQDAQIIAARHFPDLGPHQGIAALLRF